MTYHKGYQENGSSSGGMKETTASKGAPRPLPSEVIRRIEKTVERRDTGEQRQPKK